MKIDSRELKSFINDYIRERVQADGGEIKFLSFENSLLTVQVQAECSKCHLTDTCLKEWIIQKIKEKFNTEVNMKIIRKKPYFWDK